MRTSSSPSIPGIQARLTAAVAEEPPLFACARLWHSVDMTPWVLTIAGSDPSGGAGIQADLQTLAAHHVRGAAVVTCATVQNTRGVHAVTPSSTVQLQAELRGVVDDMRLDAIKVGALGNVDVAHVVIDVLRHTNVPSVVDPIVLSTSGAKLVDGDDDDVRQVLRELVSWATVATPNRDEAAWLTGLPVDTKADAIAAARHLLQWGDVVNGRAVVVTGGHDAQQTDVVEDVLVFVADGQVRVKVVRHPRRQTEHTHGTGCALSSSIAARLALGDTVVDAVEHAIHVVDDGLRHAYSPGQGRGPVHVLSTALSPAERRSLALRDSAPLADDDDVAFMQQCLQEAAQAADHGDVPVGALVVKDGVVVGRGHNVRERDGDPTGHAEVVALQQAAAHLGSWRLDGCTLYVTLEPCFMCAGAVVNARVSKVVFGAWDARAGAVGSVHNVCDDPHLNHRVDVVAGVCHDACQSQLQVFFQQLRDGDDP